MRLREKAKRDFSTSQTDTFAGAKVEEKASVCFGRNDKIAAILTVANRVSKRPTRTAFWSGETVGLRERTKREFSTPQTDTFAGTKVEEKASVCFGRNDKFAGRFKGRNLRSRQRARREISPLRRPTPSQERRWKKRRRSASVEMTRLRRY